MNADEMKFTQLKKLELLREKARNQLVRDLKDTLDGELSGRTKQLYELRILTRAESDHEHVKNDVALGRASPLVLGE